MPLIITEGLGSVGSGVLQALSAVPTETTLTITFTGQPVLSGPAAIPAGWSIVSSSGHSLVISSVVAHGITVVLTTEGHVSGLTYTVNFPAVGIQGPGGEPYSGPYSIAYTGVGVSVVIVSVRAPDSRHVSLTFSEPVIASEALTVANYSIDNGISVLAVEQISPVIFELSTSLQVAHQAYGLTASNIHTI